MNYFLGIDQGGTKTQVAICAEDGKLIGFETGQPSIFYLDDQENKSTAIARYLAEKIITDYEAAVKLSAACGGLTGIDWPHEVPIHEERLREGLNLNDIIAVNDCIIAMRAGSAAPNRCIICCGTGMNMAVHTSDGTQFAYGYYPPGHLMGGTGLGNAVLNSVMEAEMGVIMPTMLTNIVLSHCGYKSVEQLLIDLTTRKFSFAIQTLAPGLFDAAVAGDSAACRIIDTYVKGMVDWTKSLLLRFFPSGCNIELVYSGGLFKGNGNIIAKAMTKILLPDFPKVSFINARYEPVCGALLLLLDRHYNNNIPGNVKERFDKSCIHYGLIRDMGGL